MVESSEDAIIATTPDGVITSWSPGSARMNGFVPGEMIGPNIAEPIPADRADEQVSIVQRPRRGEPVDRLETQQVGNGGKITDVLVSIPPIRLANGTTVGVAPVTRDISEQLQAHARAAWLAAIVDSCDDAIIGKTLQGVITSWNPGATAMYGYAPEEMIGQNIARLLPADRSGELAPILERLGRGERVSHYQTRRLRKDGSELEVSVSISPVRDAAGTVTGAASVARDISARLEAEAGLQVMEARLRQAQRLETVGQLAGGVAHDFNNLLAVIVGSAGLLAERLGDQPELRADVNQILSTAERAARLTRQLLIFSGRDMAQPQRVNLNDAVAEVRELLAVTLGARVALVLEPTRALPPVRVDPGHVEQVLLNLAVNARDAMPGGGTLRVATGVAELDAAYCAAHPGTRPGRHVVLTISDNGIGMSPEVAARAFEPFFTTKPLGKGTGLGLATVHGVVTQAGGSVSVESQEGAGTVFRCYFPSAAAPTARVLVVDDEPRVRSTTSRILRGDGYQVVEAGDAAKALTLLSSSQTRVDLLLTDVVTPQMSGAALAERAMEICPGIRVLCMSGYSAEHLFQEEVALGELEFIGMPFTAAALLGKVRSVLAAAEPG